MWPLRSVKIFPLLDSTPPRSPKRPIATAAKGKPIWVTETGVATWDLALGREDKFTLQSQLLREALLQSPAERLYWYSLIDLDPALHAIGSLEPSSDKTSPASGLKRVDRGRPAQLTHRHRGFDLR
jgi:hypothetical protein